MLEVKSLNAFYGPVQVLHDVNLTVPAGQIVGLVGANAAGKSTLMFTLAGLRTTHTGDITLDGQSVSDLPAYERVVARARAGARAPAAVPVHDGARKSGNRRLFAGRARGRRARRCRRCIELLPVLAERRSRWPARSAAASSRCWPSAAR